MPTGDVWDKLLFFFVLGGMALFLLRDVRTLLRLIAQWRTDRKGRRHPTSTAVFERGRGSEREYTYNGTARLGVLLAQGGGVALILISVLSAIVLLALLFQSGPYPPIDLIRCLLLCDLAAGWLLGAGLMNALPTVWMSEEGVAISVYFRGRVMIPWGELVDVKPLPLLPGCYLVRARRITPIHTIYGWLARAAVPSFIIHQSIDGRDQLLRELSRRISERQHEENGDG